MQVIYVLARCSVFSLGREEKGHKPKRKLKTKLNGFLTNYMEDWTTLKIRQVINRCHPYISDVDSDKIRFIQQCLILFCVYFTPLSTCALVFRVRIKICIKHHSSEMLRNHLTSLLKTPSRSHCLRSAALDRQEEHSKVLHIFVQSLHFCLGD